MAEWKKFIGSSEQIQELWEADKTYGFMVLWKAGNCSRIIRKDWNGVDIDIDKYLICEPHPLADMIRHQASTGQPVWITMIEHVYWTSRLDEYDGKYTKEGKVVIKSWHPNWNIADAEYSFFPCDGWVEL